MRITKIEAAQRQLETAIFLLFSDEDPISIHTLAIAASRVLRDLCEAKGELAIWDLYIKDEYKKDAIVHFNKAANFFKHADTDFDEVFDWNYNERLNDYTILVACFDYTTINGKLTWPMQVFVTWMR
jgi:hypothetical protein